MIVWSSPVKLTLDDSYIAARLWALEVERWCIDLTRKFMTVDGKWHYSPSSYYSIAFTKHFSLGKGEAIVYDGIHKSFSLGFLHIVWGG